MKTALRLLLAGLIALAGFSYAIPELTNTEATNVDTAAERLAWQQAIGTDFEGKSGNFTAEVNGRYVATATLTVTDPSTPAAGDSFVVYVRAGTATVGGTAYATAGTIIVRAYASGAWASKSFTPDDAVAITGGTITGLSSASITGDLTVDTSTLKVDSANNRVGIGTASPSYPLHVLGDVFIAGDGSVPIDPSTPGFYLGKSPSDANRRLEIVTGGTAAYIDFHAGGVDMDGRILYSTSGDTMYFFVAGNFDAATAIDGSGVQVGTSRSVRFASNSGSWNGATIAGDQTASGAWTFNGNFSADKTITAAATTGAQTINKNAGSVNFAAAATSLVVTNSRVTANSVIICTIGTNDATMTSVQAVAGSGSFTIYANAAPTAETRVNFLIIN